MSFEQASELIKEGNENKSDIQKEKTGIIKKTNKKENSFENTELYKFITNEENLNLLIKTLIGEFDIKSIVMNDTNFIKDDGKRYVMLGCGCGFSFIKFDGRSKKTKEIVDLSRIIKKSVENKIVEKIGKETINYLVSIGNPIYAHFMQNLIYNSKYNSIVVKFIEKTTNCKKVWIDNRED